MMIPNFLKEYAHDMTILRIDENKKRYQDTHKQRIGTINSVLLGNVSREYYTEYIGILSEMIIRDRLDRDVLCSSYQVSTLIKKAELVYNDCDITMVRDGEVKRISVKGCEGSMKANKQAIDSEDVDSVVFVIYKDPEKYILKGFTPSQIRNWEVRSAFSDYYFREI